MKNYWERTVSRRNVLRGAAIGGTSLAALSVLNCGGSNSNSGAGNATSKTSLITQPTDTSAQAKRGGTYASVVPNDETNLDPFTTSRGAGSGGVENKAYQKLIKGKEAFGGTPTAVFEGDAAESFELSSDGLQLTAKLRANNHFDPRPPTNGRLMNAQDVKYSWDRLVATSTYASVLAYNKDPAVPIESVTAVDAQTVVYKMHFPWAALIGGLAEGGPHQIAPVESESGYNPKNTIRGSNAWMLDSYETSVAFNWKRNPGYFNADIPYLDGVSQPIVTEPAARLGQFRAKNIWDIVPNRADVPDTYTSTPGVQIYEGDMPATFGHIWFNGLPTNPFRDVRMRRAVSLAVDRQTYAEATTEADRLRKFGIDPEIIINNNIPGGARDFWLDPVGKDMGDAAQYFKFDPAAAKALVAAAGYPNGLDLNAPISNNQDQAQMSALLQFLVDVGMRIKINVVDYNTIFLPLILSARGDWSAGGGGDITVWGGAMGFSPATGLQRVFHPAGATSRVSCFGKACDDDHAKITAMIEKALQEIDPVSYKSQISDLQRAIGSWQGAVTYNSSTPPLGFAWPWVKNWRAFRLVNTDTSFMHLWIDDTLKT